MAILNKLNPTPGFIDFWNEFRKPTPYRWPILGLSMLITFTLMYHIVTESMLVPPPPPKITYISSFAADRTDAQIIASNIENQKNQDAIAALIEQSEERKREIYRTLGRATGMDVDEIERKNAQERAVEEEEEADFRRRSGIIDPELTSEAVTEIGQKENTVANSGE